MGKPEHKKVSEYSSQTSLRATDGAIHPGTLTTGSAEYRVQIKEDPMAHDTQFKEGYPRIAPKLQLGHNFLACRAS